MYLPEYKRYKISEYSKNKEKIIQFLVEEDIQYLDIDEILFNKQNFEKYFPLVNKYHYNKDGYKQISEILINFLNKQQR